MRLGTSEGFSRTSPVDVSVVIPTFNSMSGSKCVAKTIKSAMRQEDVYLEVIVVDNESEDGTETVCRELGVRFHSESSTRSKARNLGLDMAKGEYVLFLDSDHELQDGALTAAVSLARKGNLDAVFLKHLYVIQNPDGTISESPLNLELKIRTPNKIPNLYRKSSIRRLRFNPHMDFAEDYAFFKEFLRQYPRLGELDWGLIHYDPPDIGDEIKRSYSYGRAFCLGPTVPEASHLMLRTSIASGFSMRTLVRTIVDRPKEAFRVIGGLALKYAAFLLGYISAIFVYE